MSSDSKANAPLGGLTERELRLVVALRDTEDHARLLVQGLDDGRRWEVYERNRALLDEMLPPKRPRHPRPLRAKRVRPLNFVIGQNGTSSTNTVSIFFGWSADA